MNRCSWCLQSHDTQISFADLLYRSSSRSKLCRQCQSLLQPVDQEANKCMRCEKKSEQTPCLDCLNWEKRYPDYPFKHRSLYYYNDFAKEYMESYKVMGDCEMSALFAHELRACFKSRFKGSLIVPIPISLKSRQTRGFNQVELMLESAGIPYSDLLENRGEGEKQSRKNKSERMNMRQPFVVKAEATSVLAEASIVVVDDLYTTGRTMFYAAEALKNHGTSRIESFSLFR